MKNIIRQRYSFLLAVQHQNEELKGIYRKRPDVTNDNFV